MYEPTPIDTPGGTPVLPGTPGAAPVPGAPLSQEELEKELVIWKRYAKDLEPGNVILVMVVGVILLVGLLAAVANGDSKPKQTTGYYR